tara:strand:+ start:35 stop:448 length:414 start_codon:yes stop_codon:yes gene_type:complete
MPSQTAYTQLFFDDPINVSLTKGDTIYYVSKQSSQAATTGTTFNVDVGNIRLVGTVYDIIHTNNSIVCEFTCDPQIIDDCDKHIPSFADGDFIMFSKDSSVNRSSLVGYYAEVKMVHSGTEKGKIFAVSTDVTESSK